MENDWTRPAAMAIPKGGFDPETAKQGRYGPIFPKTPACYGFSIIAKLIPGATSGFAVTLLIGDTEQRFVDVDAEAAYARAVLALLASSA